MHLNESTLLVCLVGESRMDVFSGRWFKKVNFVLPDKTISPRHTGDWIEHNFGTLTAKERADELGFTIVP